ncbi:exopolyphosphatase PRUNE1 isoform X2 [Lagopus leucura]|uniref:exopolyphosphatase PRUNE1 isoform X2 n=1 Tax=Lagopus leucura TaxID=30410 RepID=UPI001C676B05|nr:exopolyphosphatase PRUNE1 isoform X2 [Lagopus leucura]
MERFLEGRRAALQEHIQRRQEVHVVMGNEACDLDSTVSALALAYFLAKTSVPPRAAFIPVLNIPRADFALRTETTFLLREHSIPDSSLIFRDEIDLAGLHSAGLLSLTLVDHHVLPSADAALEEAVVDVLDHRPLEREWAPSCQLTVELVGSCATLVTERIAQGPPGVLDRTTAALLHGTILLDSVNLSPAAGKVTPRDVRCVSLLESRFPELPPHDSIYGALQAAKFNVSGLTTEQMLRKDLKTVSGDEQVLATSGIYMDIELFLRRPGLLQDLEAFCQARGYSVLVAMTVSFNECYEPKRQLAVYSWHEALRSTVCRALEEATTPALQLQALPSPWPCISAYTQGNTLASRKKVLPILRATLGGTPGTAAGMEEEVAPPPTPMNSLVEESPLAQAVPPVCPQAVLERVSRMAAEQPPPDCDK